MASLVLVTRSTEETIERGREVGAHLKSPALILIFGELGAGKTTLTKGIVSGFGAAREDEVTSPTFTLVHKYDRGGRVYHVDLYRVADIRDFETLGLDDIFNQPAVVVVEWPEKFALRADWPIVRIHLEHVSENERRISIDDSANLLDAGLKAP